MKMLPDLMLVDGGKGQLTTTNIKQSIFKDIKIASIANKKKNFFLKKRIDNLKNGSYGKHLIQRIGMAHRFAVDTMKKI